MAGEDKAGQNSLGGSGLLIAIGRLGRPHGVRGEIRLKLFFGFDHVYALAGKAVVLKGESEQSGRTACLAGAREISGGYCLLVLEGVSSPESAREFSNLLLMAPKNILPALPEGHYYHEEIVGLPVFDPDGGKIGRLAGFFEDRKSVV